MQKLENWTVAYKSMSKLYILEFESRWEEGERTANGISTYISSKFPKVKRILDIPCGNGRLSLPLGKRGFHVLGIDSSEPFIVDARERLAGFSSINVQFEKGDTRDLSTIVGHFDADVIINWWTSIGYVSKSEDIKFFHDLWNLSKRKTVLFLETWHRNYIISNPLRYRYGELGNRICTVIENKFDRSARFVLSEHKYYKKVGGDLKLIGKFKSKIMLYSADELIDMLKSAGWEVLDKFNSIENTKSFDLSKDRIVLVAVKE